MSWEEILIIVSLVLFAGFILYRALKNKDRCPDIYGAGSCGVKIDEENSCEDMWKNELDPLNH